jgi:hypothetical protein
MILLVSILLAVQDEKTRMAFVNTINNQSWWERKVSDLLSLSLLFFVGTKTVWCSWLVVHGAKEMDEIVIEYYEEGWLINYHMMRPWLQGVHPSMLHLLISKRKHASVCKSACNVKVSFRLSSSTGHEKIIWFLTFVRIYDLWNNAQKHFHYLIKMLSTPAMCTFLIILMDSFPLFWEIPLLIFREIIKYVKISVKEKQFVFAHLQAFLGLTVPKYKKNHYYAYLSGVFFVYSKTVTYILFLFLLLKLKLKVSFFSF